MDAVLRHGRRRDGENVLLDLPGQAFQGEPDGLRVHFVQLVQDQFRDRNGLQVGIAAAPADVQDVGAGGLQADRVGVNEQGLQIGAEFQCGGEAGLGKVARIQRRRKHVQHVTLQLVEREERPIDPRFRDAQLGRLHRHGEGRLAVVNLAAPGVILEAVGTGEGRSHHPAMLSPSAARLQRLTQQAARETLLKGVPQLVALGACWVHRVATVVSEVACQVRLASRLVSLRSSRATSCFLSHSPIPTRPAQVRRPARVRRWRPLPARRSEQAQVPGPARTGAELGLPRGSFEQGRAATEGRAMVRTQEAGIHVHFVFLDAFRQAGCPPSNGCRPAWW